MRWIGSTAFLAALLATAGVVAGARHLATLDGPLHVLHGWMLGERMAGGVPGSHGLHYAVEKAAPRITDAIVLPVLRVWGPDAAHQALASMTILLLGLACFAWCRSANTARGMDPWLALPVLIGAPFVLGFFPFLLGVAVALGAMAWMRAQQQVRGSTIVVGTGWVIACLLVHRGALFLLALLVAGEVVARMHQGKGRWKGTPQRRSILLLLIAVLGLGLLGIRFLLRERIVEAAPRDPLTHLLTGAPLLLVDAEREAPLMILLGAILMLSIGFALYHRWRSGDARADGLWWSAALLLGASFIIRSPGADLHYFVERAQWTALLFFTLAASAGVPRGRFVPLLVASVLVVHGIRLGFLEHRMAQSGKAHQELLLAIAGLNPGSVVLPLFRTQDHLRTHEAAQVMMRHDGFVLSHREPWWYRRGTPASEWMRRHVGGRLYHPAWLRALHQQQGPLPEILVIGTDPAARDSSWVALSPLLGELYRLKVQVGEVGVWVEEK